MILTLEDRVDRLEKFLYRDAPTSPKEYPREGADWNSIEKALLYDRVNMVIGDLSREYGRSPNAIWWAVYKYASKHKR